VRALPAIAVLVLAGTATAEGPRSQPASQPASQLASGPRLAVRLLAPPARAALDLELRALPEPPPRFHAVKPFAELVAYQAFLVGSGWIYGHSPLDWDPPSWSKWRRSFTSAPIYPDGDSLFVNYGGHTVMGSDMYLMARGCGWSWYSAVAFNAFGSFFWEYVTEGIFERPSLLDLVVTPTLGSLAGEARYQLRRRVARHWGTRWYGKVLMGVLDPTHTVFDLLGWH
jgi:hypothetical protein